MYNNQMHERNFWKNQYKDKWGEGNSREAFVKEFLEKHGCKVEYFGFHAGDTKYDSNRAKEKGIPDLKLEINGKVIFVEVTGSRFLRGQDLWVRPDKILYAKRHREKEVWTAHVVDSEGLIRFIHSQVYYKIIDVEIRGNLERFASINKDSLSVISSKEFIEYLNE